MELVPAIRADTTAIDFARLKAALFVLPSAERGEHVLLRCRTVHIRIDVTGGTVLDGPVVPRIGLAGFDRLVAQCRTLYRLRSLVRTGDIPFGLRMPERRASRWRQMLQAFDADCAGASQRDIAALLFGGERVAAEWRGASDHLRLKVQRLLREARRMVRGGYRSILAGAVDTPEADRA